MVDQMTFSEFFASIKGYADSHSSEKGGEAPSEDEYLRVLMEEQIAGRA
jgi:hypothetical protein